MDEDEFLFGDGLLDTFKRYGNEETEKVNKESLNKFIEKRDNINTENE